MPDGDKESGEELWEAGRVVLGLYEIGEELGRGGMGVVHKVRHRTWNHWMAVKSPRPEVLSGPRGRDDFVREAELWVNLPTHPNVVTCHYVRTIGGIPRIFAEYVDGGSLRDRIAKAQLTRLEDMLDIAIQMAWGLGLAHGERLVHQDVKPGNVMLTQGGIAKVTDFGLSRARARAAGEGKVTSGTGEAAVSVRGATKEYASPEQMAGERLTGKTDIWSWGVTVLDMFTGGVSCTYGELAGSVLDEYLKQAPQEGPLAMPEGLAALLRHCFALEPDDRPRDFGEVADRLRDIYREAVGAIYPREVPQKTDFLADGLNNRALSMLDLQKAEEAKRLWKEALEADPDHPDSSYNYGLLRWRNAETDDMTVVHRLEEVCRVRAGDWLPPYLLALVHLERHDCESAIAALETIPEGEGERDAISMVAEWARHHLRQSDRLLDTINGQESDVRSVQLGADGRLAVSGGFETVMLWNLPEGRSLISIRAHPAQHVNAVCLSNDGRHVFSGSTDGKLKLWDLATGQCLRSFEGHTYDVNSVCLSPDGRAILSGSSDGTLRLWNVATADCLSALEGGGGKVNSACLSPDGRRALSGNGDGMVRLWDLSTASCVRAFAGHAEGVNSVCLSADARQALSGSSDRTVKLWQVDSGECIRTLAGHRDKVTSVCISTDARYALSGSKDWTIKLWELGTGRCLRTFQGHEDQVNSVFLAADQRQFLSGSGNIDENILADDWLTRDTDQTLRLWSIDLEDRAQSAPLQFCPVAAGQQSLERQVAFREATVEARQAIKQGSYSEAACKVREARSIPGYGRAAEAIVLWSELYVHLPCVAFRTAWESPVFRQAGTAGTVNDVKLSEDGRYAVSCNKEGEVHLWDLASGKRLRTLVALTSFRHVASLCLDAEGKRLLTGSSAGTLSMWDIATGKCLQTLEGHKGMAHSVCLSADGRFALSGSADETLKLWDIATGKCLRTFEGHTSDVLAACLSADGRYALSGGYENTVRLWDAATGRLLRTFEGHSKGVPSVCLSADGSYALSGSYDGTLKLWKVGTGACERTFAGHTGFVRSVCLSIDGRHALSGSEDKTAKLWEVATGRCLRTFVGHAELVVAVHLSSDARYAISGSDEGTLKVWFLDWELEEREPADWDEEAGPYLEAFIRLHRRSPSRLLRRQKPPSWTDREFRELLHTLGCAGYGWLRPEGVRTRLEELATRQV